MAAVLTAIASSCTSVRYLAHVAQGEVQLLGARRPLDQVIAATNTDPALAARLALARDARHFASAHLHLPDNRSYTTYADLKRPYVVWNVFAAPRYSVDAVLQCFPIAGCVPYRGYFDESLARARARELQAQGNDVYVAGVAAYSTLGWFADPILSTMLRWGDDELIGTIFHELAHQLIYVKDDTAFNESFAMFVQDEGVREWRAARGEAAPAERSRAMDHDFARLALDLRERLKQLYPSPLAAPAMETTKQREIDGFRARYRDWRDTHWPEDHRYDTFVAAPINNASLLPFGLYDQWTPAFAALFVQSNRQWPGFYERARALAKLKARQRKVALDALLATQQGPAPSITPAPEQAAKD